MKVALIGCTHAGTAAILNTVALYPEAKVTVYERNDNISFLSCGIALYVEGLVKDPQGLFYCSPEVLAEKGVTTRMKHDVLSVDMDAKKLKVKDLETGKEFEDTYDKLIITSGSWPIQPKFENGDLGNIMICKNYTHAMQIAEKTPAAKNVVIVGAGYIGTELIQSFEVRGKNVTVIDMETQILPKYMDREFAEVVMKAYDGKKIKLALGEKVCRFNGDANKNVASVTTDKGEYPADLVILCIGFAPNTAIFKGQLDMMKNGAILVDEYMHTSKPDVFAAGDSAAVHYNPSGTCEYIPLATNAVRMGTLVARNLKKPTTKYMGTQATSGIKIYEYSVASTGMTEILAKNFNVDYEVVSLKDNYRPEFMPSTAELMLKILYCKNTRRILGGQILSTEDLTPAINALSIAIQKGMTIDELAFVDCFFQPHFNKPWNYLNAVALQALPKID